MTPEQAKKAVETAKTACEVAKGYKAAYEKVAATLPPADLVESAAATLVKYRLIEAGQKEAAVTSLADPKLALETVINLAKVAHDAYADRDALNVGAAIPTTKSAATTEQPVDANDEFERSINDEMAKLANVAATPYV